MRSGVCVLVVVLAALAAAATAAAGGPAETTTAATTTAATTTTPPPATTTEPAPATTAETTTAAATTTAPAPAPAPRQAPARVRYMAARATALGSRCPSSGAAAIVAPGGSALAVGAAPARLGAAAYRSVVRFRGADASGGSCRTGTVSIRSLSLFGGAVTAESVVASDGRGRATGLRVDGLGVVLAPGDAVAVGTWGRLSAGVRVGDTLAAPLALRLLRPHAHLPAGTVVLVGYAGRTARKAHAAVAHRKRARRHARRRRHRAHRPLKATPPLGLTGYVFPVSGGASYADTYGGPRSDISDGWHHGDDLFAPLGTPVVAVASGKLSLVGWEKLGGWRLWLTDARGNQYYYAHLAAYSPLALHHRRVRAGQVLGFLGHTGDAFTTPPHLHFEIHPHQLLRLDYDGAVDPTRYLRRWRVVRARHVPRPLLPRRVPKGKPRVEAAVVWRQLLVARDLERRSPAPAPAPFRHALPEDDGVPAAALRAAAAPQLVPASAAPEHRGGGSTPLLLALGLGAAGALALVAAFLRRGGWATRAASARTAIRRRWREC